MTRTTANGKQALGELPKCPTGVEGLDAITGGGLPRGRPTLVCGAAGCGKTLLAMEFLVRGAVQHGEPGVFIAFEETSEELTQNVRSLGFDLEALKRDKKLAVDHVQIESGDVEENGEYDLGGLFIRIGYAIDAIGAKRVVLDTIETLFGGLTNQAILRSEVRRLFRWLKEKGVTAVITAERGEGTLTRSGIEEYVSDCVILLDHRVTEQVSTRRVRVVKYRGTSHGTNEYPFLIDASGFSVLPVTSMGLEYEVPDDRISTGVARLDSMLGGKGIYRGSTALISGTAGTGKSSLAAHFVDAAVKRGERCIYFAFEESVSQILRNMRSIGIDLRAGMKKGLLRFVAARPSLTGLETHLASMQKQIRDFDPSLVVLDPISNLADAGTLRDATAMLTRLIDYMKSRQTTGVFTCLTTGGRDREATDIGISSLIDAWLLVRDIELGGERNRGLYVLKARGIAHSNQIREFLITSHGIDLQDVYVGPEGVLTGSMRLAQEERERAVEWQRRNEAETRRRALERKRQALEAQIAGLRAELADDEAVMQTAATNEADRTTHAADARKRMGRSRMADASAGGARGERGAKGNGKPGART